MQSSFSVVRYCLFYWLPIGTAFSFCVSGKPVNRDQHAGPVEVGRMDSIKTMNGISFSPGQEKMYTSWIISNNRNQNGKYQTRLFEHRNMNGVFEKGKLISFSDMYVDYHPVVSPDGEKMFFNSLRPMPGDTGELKKTNIWVSVLKDKQWQKPELLFKTATDYGDSYPSVAASGNLYFTSARPGSSKRDIYVAINKKGNFETPQAIDVLNSEDDENDITVDPGERFMIFNVYRYATKSIEMFIAYRKKKAWDVPIPITDKLGGGKDAWNLTPTISPDGKWFLFERDSRVHKVLLDSIVSKASMN